MYNLSLAKAVTILFCTLEGLRGTGGFPFLYPKGALTHHLLKHAVVALPLVGHVRSSPGQEPPAAVALRNAPAGAVRGGLRLLREPPDDATARLILLSSPTQLSQAHPLLRL